MYGMFLAQPYMPADVGAGSLCCILPSALSRFPQFKTCIWRGSPHAQPQNGKLVEVTASQDLCGENQGSSHWES